MPVIRTNKKKMGQDNRPEWCNVTNAGMFSIPTKNGRADCHYHDCDEYWLVFRGKAKIMTEDQTFYVGAGDIVCTQAGDEHDIIEVYEDLEAFYFEGTTPAGGRVGHRHRDAVKAEGHPVPSLPVPNDFPQ